MSGAKQNATDAVHGVAGDIVTRAEPGVDRAIANEAVKRGIVKPGERLNSETAHQLSAAIAREADARRSR